MKVFLSWSGKKSRVVAEGLRDSVLLSSQVIKPWMSCDMDPGGRWYFDLAENLSDTNVGVLCLTKENSRSPWVLFEAGALSKSVEHSCVIPYLIDLNVDDLPEPLQQFQCVQADKEGTLRLLQHLFDLHPDNKRPDEVMNRLFKMIWPDMEKALDKASAMDLLDNFGNRINDDEKLVLFLSIGGTCRCAMANVLVRHLLRIGCKTGPIISMSAALGNKTSEFITAEAQQVLREELSVEAGDHRTLRATPELLKRADVIVPVTQKLMRAVDSEFQPKCFLFSSFFGLSGDIDDPYNKGIDEYRKCYALLKRAILDNPQALVALQAAG